MVQISIDGYYMGFKDDFLPLYISKTCFNSSKTKMKGIQQEIEKLNHHIKLLMRKQKQNCVRQVYDVSFYCLSQRCLQMSDIILMTFNIPEQIRQSYSTLVKTIKQLAKSRPNQQSQTDSFLDPTDEITTFLNSRRPVKDEQQKRENLGDYLILMQKKRCETQKFLRKTDQNYLNSSFLQSKKSCINKACQTQQIKKKSYEMQTGQEIDLINSEEGQCVKTRQQSIQNKKSKKKVLIKQEFNEKTSRKREGKALKKIISDKSQRKKKNKNISSSKSLLNKNTQGGQHNQYIKSEKSQIDKKFWFENEYFDDNLSQKALKDQQKYKISIKQFDNPFDREQSLNKIRDFTQDQESDIKLMQNQIRDRLNQQSQQLQMNKMNFMKDQQNKNNFLNHFSMEKNCIQIQDLKEQKQGILKQKLLKSNHSQLNKLSQGTCRNNKILKRRSLAKSRNTHNISLQNSDIYDKKNTKTNLSMEFEQNNHKRGQNNSQISFPLVKKDRNKQSNKSSLDKLSKISNISTIKRQNLRIQKKQSPISCYNWYRNKKIQLGSSLHSKSSSLTPLQTSYLSEEEEKFLVSQIEKQNLTPQYLQKNQKFIIQKVKEIHMTLDKNSANTRKIEFYIELMKKTHEKACGKNCMHLNRFNEFLRKNKIQVSKKAFPIKKYIIGDNFVQNDQS